MNDDPLPHPENEPITEKDLQNLIGELRAMARQLLFRERGRQSLTPTALAMSALRRAKLHDQEWDDVRWENRAHFFSILVIAMRHALIDRVRAALAQKNPPIVYVPIDDPLVVNFATPQASQSTLLIALDEAMARLRKEEAAAQAAKDRPGVPLTQVVELHYYMGYTTREMAAFLAVDEKTVDRYLKRARTILEKYIKEELPRL